LKTSLLLPFREDLFSFKICVSIADFSWKKTFLLYIFPIGDTLLKYGLLFALNCPVLKILSCGDFILVKIDL
jgi:hypothetical protein